MTWFAPLALIMDIVLPDPRNLPHPVRGIGFLANRLEAPARQMGAPVFAGAVVVFGLCLISGSAVFLLCSLPSFLGLTAALYFSWSGLALGGLIREGKTALTAIERAEQAPEAPEAMEQARQAVQMLVSRDTGDMDVEDLYRSLAETVSENLNDAFVAPYFWLCLTGPVGLWMYKTVSTMDSMWGYRTERWEYLGKAAARLDDVLAWLPARLCLPLMVCTAWLSELPHILRNRDWHVLFRVSGWPGLRIVAAQARLSSSPNAGWPMATAAWLFNGRNGGPTPYDGNIADKPLMGPAEGRWQAANCLALFRHARNCGLLCCALSLLWLL